MTALVIAEHDHGALKNATLHTIAAAQKLGGDIHVLVAGHNAGSAAQAAASIAGVAKVLHADAAHLASQTAENLALLATSLAAPYYHLFLPATGFGKNVAPRIAALLDVAQVSDIIGVVAPHTFVRPICAGNAFATVQSKDPKIVVTVGSTGFDAAPSTGGSAASESVWVPGE